MQIRSLTLMTIPIALAVCFTATGCQSGFPGRVNRHGCEGGACAAPTSRAGGGHHDAALTGFESATAKDSPAALFAEMNYERIADQQNAAIAKAEKVAKIPRGPDSLFAAMR